MSDMERKIYVTPVSEVVPLTGERLLDDGVEILNDGGRFAIITFHSMEDRIVKEKFKTWENPCTCPKDFPVCICGKKPLGKVITKKPVTSSEDEIRNNRRAHSCKLRIFERKR